MGAMRPQNMLVLRLKVAILPLDLLFSGLITHATNINEPKLEWNSDNHKDTVISPDELEKALKLMQNGKSPG
jgi:hypothetical protein